MSERDELLTVEQLSERTGISVRNLRFYTSRGLVPPPLRQGRTAGYTPRHVALFELVRDLTEQGLSLAAVEGYLKRLPTDATPAQIALHQALMRPFVAEQDTPATSRLDDLGVPPEVVRATEEVYRRHTRAMAEELGRIFREQVWPAYRSGELSTEQLVGMLESFQQSWVGALVGTFSEAMAQARRSDLERRTH